MANTTGTTNTFVLTRDQVITAALRKLRVINPAQTPSSTDITTGAEALNVMLKAWPTKGLFLWCRTQVVVPLVANQITYTLGPSGANVTCDRPLRVMEGSFIRLITNGITQDTRLKILSRLEYMHMAAKSTPAVVNSIYYDPQTGTGAYNPVNAKGVLYVFPAPVDATRSLYLETQRPIQEMTATGDMFDVPAEWYKPLIYGLAAELADEYEVPENRITRVKKEWGDAVSDLVDWGTQEAAPMFFTPDYQVGAN